MLTLRALNVAMPADAAKLAVPLVTAPPPFATMDTVTLIRSGIRGVFKAAGADLEAQLRAVIRRDDDYATAGKPVCDYDDRAARKQLVDALAKDGTAVLVVLEGRELDPAATQA